MGNILSTKNSYISGVMTPPLQFNSNALAGYDVTTAGYSARVQADGGIVYNTQDVSSAVTQAKQEGWYDYVKLWYAGFGGYKLQGSTVSKWYNIVGSVSNPYDAVQVTGSLQPSFVSSYIPLNSKPVLKFNPEGSNNDVHLQIHGANTLFPSEATVSCCYYVNRDNTYSVYGTAALDQWWRLDDNDSLFYGAFRSARAGTSIATTTAHPKYVGGMLTTIVSSASEYSIYQGTILQTSSTPSYSAGGMHRISDKDGSFPDATRPLNGHIAEVIVLNKALSANQRSYVENRLRNRYVVF